MRTGILVVVSILLVFISCEELTNIPFSATSYDLWRSFNLHDYTIEQVRYCFCPDAGEKVKVTVRSDSVYSVMRLSDSAIIPYPTSKLYLSVDSLFGVIQNSKNDSLVVTYDSKYGYPNKLDINPQLHPVDGGVMYETSNLQIPK
jgi:hypothetical protein